MKVEAAPSFFKSLKNIGSLKNKYYSIRGWFRYHFKKDFWKIIITAFKGYPWQESFLYELEEVKIHEMMNYHKRTNRFVGVEYVLRDMQICLKLIDIFNNDDTKLFHFTGSIDFIPIEGSDNVELKNNNLQYHCDVKVNTRNIDRFILNENQKEHYLKHPHELYVLKAKYLYHKIRYEKDSEWWD